jgi:hypothetical protein
MAASRATERQISPERLAYCQASPSFLAGHGDKSEIPDTGSCSMVVRIHQQHTETLFGCRIRMGHSDYNDIKRCLHVFLISLAHC